MTDDLTDGPGPSTVLRRQIGVMGEARFVAGDPEYLGRMGEAFEPETVAMLAALCDKGAIAVDVGANIGLTTLALSRLCDTGRVWAIEPVPSTFALLEENLQAAGAGNVSTLNLALGANEGSVSMFVNDANRATSFVVDVAPSTDLLIPLTTLDTLVARLKPPHLEFIKIDVEGFELEVLRGSRNTLAEHRPNVMLEMNHWCLNVFRRTSLPDFRDELLETFPFVFAVDGGAYLDFSDVWNTSAILEAHVFQNRYMNLVAGFDRSDLTSRLGRISAP